MGADVACRAQPDISPSEKSVALAAGDDRFLGERIGSYTIKRRIAEGGMGAVYLAEQESPRREVALKIMTSGFWSRSAQRRFEYETQILGRLHHPNIAQVYEAGVHHLEIGAPIPFFAMEYIPGAKTITAFCDDHGLALRARLHLFCQACDAVHYGHQNGVIHRDLKPGNMLIDSNGHVKIIDFGVARSTDSDIAATTMHTEAGQLIGTLAYMSPEQCSTGFQPVTDEAPGNLADIDTRSDVYSLGVVLFELLTCRLPYDVSHMTIASAARVICEQEPARGSEVAAGTCVSPARLRGDLDTIILKCLEKDRGKRYSSVAALADDIDRYLRGEPIAARPPTPWTRALRWAARHPKLAVTLASVAIAVCILSATTVLLWIAHNRPDRLELTLNGQLIDSVLGDRPVDKGDRARLYAFNSRVLKDWNFENKGIITFAKLCSRPAKWGGGQVVVIGFGRTGAIPYPGELCSFHASGPYDEPIWHKTIEQEEINRMPRTAWPGVKYDPNRQYTTNRFSVQRGWMLDVFPGEEHPGDEIVVYFNHDPGSQGVLRIYNIDGQLLFQTWQDGGISNAYWLAESRRLVLSAIKGDKDGREYGLRMERNHPWMILAIEPKPGQITQAWINPHPPDWDPAAEWYQPAWCKMPCPPIFVDTFDCAFYEAPATSFLYNGRDLMQLRLIAPKLRVDQNCAFSFGVILDQDGNIEVRLQTGDGIRLALGDRAELPDPKSFELLDWTGPNSPCGASTAQPGKSKY